MKTVWKVCGEPTGLSFKPAPPPTRAYWHFVARYGWHNVASAASAMAPAIGLGWELAAQRYNDDGSMEWWLGAPR